MKFTWHARYNHSDWMFNALTNHPSDIAQTNGLGRQRYEGLNESMYHSEID